MNLKLTCAYWVHSLYSAQFRADWRVCVWCKFYENVRRIELNRITIKSYCFTLHGVFVVSFVSHLPFKIHFGMNERTNDEEKIPNVEHIESSFSTLHAPQSIIHTVRCSVFQIVIQYSIIKSQLEQFQDRFNKIIEERTEQNKR